MGKATRHKVRVQGGKKEQGTRHKEESRPKVQEGRKEKRHKAQGSTKDTKIKKQRKRYQGGNFLCFVSSLSSSTFKLRPSLCLVPCGLFPE